MIDAQYTYSRSLSGDDVRKIHGLLGRTYWANQRTLDEVARSMETSIVVVVRHAADGLVGCARAVTDKVTFSWICDVVVHEAHRGRGLGGELVRQLLARPEIEGTRKVLVTRDAQDLYRKLGFQTHRYECMIRYPAKDQAPGETGEGAPRGSS